MPQNGPTSVLTFDLGHSRCKIYQVFLEGSTIKTVEHVAVLISKEFKWPSGFKFYMCVIANLLAKTNAKGLAMAFGCPVRGDVLDAKWLFWYKNYGRILKDQFHVQYPMVMLNDAEAFATNFVYADMQLPVLCLTFGVAVGCAIIREDGGMRKVMPLEIGRFEAIVPGRVTGPTWKIATGDFFNKTIKSKSWDLPKINEEFTMRVVGIIRAVERQFKFNSVVIGGGRSGFIDSRELHRQSHGKVIQVFSSEQETARGLAKKWVEETCGISIGAPLPKDSSLREPTTPYLPTTAGVHEVESESPDGRNRGKSKGVISPTSKKDPPIEGQTTSPVPRLKLSPGENEEMNDKIYEKVEEMRDEWGLEGAIRRLSESSKELFGLELTPGQIQGRYNRHPEIVGRQVKGKSR